MFVLHEDRIGDFPMKFEKIPDELKEDFKNKEWVTIIQKSESMFDKNIVSDPWIITYTFALIRDCEIHVDDMIGNSAKAISWFPLVAYNSQKVLRYKGMIKRIHERAKKYDV